MNLQTFDFQEAPVRVLVREGAPWFVAADVCRVLEIANSRDAIAALDEDEKITVANADGNPRAGIPHQMNLISESGLYALVFKSRKPEARKFRKWVTAEVLPAIRETGRYEGASAPMPRTVADELGRLRGALLASAEAVLCGGLETGRAQQVANLAGRFLETIKLQGGTQGYEKVLGMRADAACDGFLPAGGRRAAKPLQNLPQRGLCGAEAGGCGLQGTAAGGEAGLEHAEPPPDAPACATVHGAAAVGSGAGDGPGAESADGMPGGAVGAAGGREHPQTP